MSQERKNEIYDVIWYYLRKGQTAQDNVIDIITGDYQLSTKQATEMVYSVANLYMAVSR